MSAFDSFPQSAQEALDWTWEDYQPFAESLTERDLSEDTIEAWLTDVTRLYELIGEVYSRLSVAKDIDTTDEAAEERYLHFIEQVYPRLMPVGNTINIKLVNSGIVPERMDIPMRNIRAEVELFREENIPLQTELSKLGTQYDKIIGAQSIELDGKEYTLPQLSTVYQENDRDRRERAFRLANERRLQDRDALNELWVTMFKLRQQMAANAGFDNFLEYQWKSMGRFDYTPEDARRFHAAIEDVVVPVASRIYEKRRQQLGVESLRPWDLDVDPTGNDPLRPFSNGEELEAGTETIFQQVSPDLGGYIQTMRQQRLLDLENRKGKSPGGYCTSFDMEHKPFIFMNAVGVHDDVQTMLHESGHAFHVFETDSLPYSQQRDVPMEFAEVASMAMELLASPYLTEDNGGFYSESDAARARIEHLEGNIKFWPYMAVVDRFQHWAYTNGDAALDPAACDAKWAELWQRYMPGIDTSGFDEWEKTGWHRKLHIFQVPFYYIEYGLAQLGAVQVWANSLENHAAALQQYRAALALGGTATLPDLYAAAGAKLAFDADTLQEAVDLMERTIADLEATV